MRKLKSKSTSHSRVGGNPDENHKIENDRLDPRLRGDDKQKSWNNKQRRNLFVSVFFIILAFLYFFSVIFSISKNLFKKFDPIQAEKKYSQSQWQQSQNVSPIKVLDEWAVKNGFTGWKNYEDEIVLKSKVESQRSQIIKAIQDKGVSDSFLYSYVGYKYVNGANLSLLNPEHPPLAKLFIGYSIKTFGNEHILGIGLAFVMLFLVGIISFQIHGSLLLASIALFLTAIFPLFMDQIVHGPQLELYQLFFFLLVIHMLLMGFKKKKVQFYIGAGIFYGFLLSTKTLLPFLCLFSTWIVISLWKKWKELAILFAFAALSFLLTYAAFFLQGGNFRSFLGLQKYIVVYYGNAHIPLLEFAGNYLRLIFTGSWKFWDSARSVSAYSEWNILWPILYIGGMVRLVQIWKKNKNTHMLIYFIVLYNLFVFIVPVFPRYLLLLFVPLLILL